MKIQKKQNLKDIIINKWNEIKENKILRNACIYTLIFFIFYFILGNIFSIYLNTSNQYNLFFGADSPRVLMDLTVWPTGHYRTTVHPLFVILFQPFAQVFGYLLKSDLFAAITIQSLIGGLSLGFMYLLMSKINISKSILHIFMLIFGISFSQIVFNSTIETYVFAQFFLIVTFYYALCRQNKKLNEWDIIILTILGIANIGVTITNYFVYILVLMYLVLFNKSEKISQKILLIILLITLSSSVSVVLSELQAVLFPSSKLFLKDNLNDLINDTSHESYYIESFSLNAIKTQIKTVFFNSFLSPNIKTELGQYNLEMNLGKVPIYQLLYMGTFYLTTLSAIIIFIKNNYKKIFKHKYLLLLLISFLFNFTLHIFYGNKEGFIYTLHYQFLTILILAYIFQNILDNPPGNKKQKKYIKYATIIILSLFLIIELIANINGTINMAKIINHHIGCSKYISNLTYVFPAIAIILLIAMLKIKLKTKFKIYLLLTVMVLSSIMAHKTILKNDFIYEEYSESYNEYTNQIKELQKNYNVKVSYENKSKDFYLFGMGNRTKMFYAEGALYDLKTNKKIKSYNIEKEMIVPNEYTVVLKTKDKTIVKIYENESGIYIQEGKKTQSLEETPTKINLPEFEGHKYSEILKVLHHELLYNIDKSIIKPNIMVYNSGWYRDGMMGAMVLEHTNNINLIKEWVDNIDSIYDLQNGVQEADNLGELLYLISITNSQNNIKNEIINEINKNKEKNNNYIVGYTDGQILDYYPTVVAKYAIKKSGLDITLETPNFDNYSSLTWFYETENTPNISYDSIYYPYLGWAGYHTNKQSTLYIADNFYPLSYEKEAAYANYDLLPNDIAYYKKIKLSPTHVWDAAEKFLFLIEQE